MKHLYRVGPSGDLYAADNRRQAIQAFQYGTSRFCTRCERVPDHEVVDIADYIDDGEVPLTARDVAMAQQSPGLAIKNLF